MGIIAKKEGIRIYFFEHGVQQGHVGLLGLDGVREEAISLVGQQKVDGDLLDSDDDRSFANVFLDDGAGVGVSLHGVSPPVGWLHQDLDSSSD